MTTGKGKNNFATRLENQKAQLEKNGYSAEVVVRTTPEATDMINFARMWEHIIVTADRSTRGYMARNKREDFDHTRQDFVDSVDFMVKKMQEAIKRHNIDMTGNNFVARIAQRYKISERRKGLEDEGHEAPVAAAPAAPKPERAEKPEGEKKPAKKPTSNQVDGL